MPRVAEARPQRAISARRRVYAAAYQRRRTRLVAYGQWNPPGLVDPSPVRQRVQDVMTRYGISLEAVAELTGVSSSVLIGVLYPASGGWRSHGVTPSTQAKVLAVSSLDLSRLSPGRRVSAVGTARRLQALAWLGWSGEQVAVELDVSRSAVAAWRRRTTVTARTARDVKELYDRWSMMFGPSAKARAGARRHGFTPPLGWDEDLDDQLAGPARLRPDATLVDDVAIMRRAEGAQVTLTPAEDAVLLHRLAARGLSDRAVGTRLGVCGRTVLRRRRRADLPSRWAS